MTKFFLEYTGCTKKIEAESLVTKENGKLLLDKKEKIIAETVQYGEEHGARYRKQNILSRHKNWAWKYAIKNGVGEN